MTRSVLIVDDNPRIRKTVRDILKSDPAFTACGEASNGVEAIERAVALQPQIVILDLQMPVMNGLEAAPVIIERVPKVFILFTMFGTREAESVAKQVGIHAVVSKDHAYHLIETAHNFFAEAPKATSRKASHA